MKFRSITASFVAALVAMAAPSVAAAAPEAAEAAAAPVLVSPADMAGWELAQSVCEETKPSGASQFVSGPEGQPLGAGSLQFGIGRSPQTRRAAQYAAVADKPLSALAGLGFSTYGMAEAQGVALYLELAVDLDGDGRGDETLRFDPVSNGEVVYQEWQQWDALKGLWHRPGEEAHFSLEEYLAERPDAMVAAPGLSVVAGCGGEEWGNFTGSVDAVVVDIDGAVTFDFDPSVLSVSAADASVNEGDAGSLVLTLSEPTTGSVTVTVTPTGGTAGADDYGVDKAEVVFEPGATTAELPFHAASDGVDEDDETIELTLDSAEAAVSDASAVVTIVDQDPVPAIGVEAGPTTLEPTAGPQTAVFTVSLGVVSARQVTVDYAAVDGSARGGADYSPVAGTLAFAPGEDVKQVAVPVLADGEQEADEVFSVVLSNPAHAELAASSASTTILDEDGGRPAVFYVDDVVAPEADVDTVANVVVRRFGDTRETASVVVSTAAGSASAPGDFTAVGNTTLTFGPGVAVQTVPVAIKGDNADEANEQLFLNLKTNLRAALGDSQAAVVIVDDDGPATPGPKAFLAVDDAWPVKEGAASVFTVRRSGDASGAATVQYATANGTARTNSDFTAASGTLSFAAGETAKTVSVPGLGDAHAENQEVFSLRLTSPTGDALADTIAYGTIIDDDGTAGKQAGFVVRDGWADESAGFAVEVVRLGSTTETSSVIVATANGTAGAPADYTAIPATTLTFAPGESSKTVNVAVVNDGVAEANESYLVNLSGSVKAEIWDAQATIVIRDNDGASAVPASKWASVDDAAPVAEGGAAQFTVRGRNTGAGDTVAWSLVAVSARSGDYQTSAAGTIDFGAGAVQTVSVNVLQDQFPEWPETFQLKLAGPSSGLALEDAVGAATIIDDDPGLTLAVSDVSVPETDSPTTAQFTVSLSRRNDRTVTVNYGTNTGTAGSADFTATTGSLTFNPGELVKTVSVPVNGDNVDEANETFSLILTAPVEASLADATGVATIVDDDEVSFSVSDASAGEGSGLSFSVSLGVASTQTVSVAYATQAGTAAAGADFTAASGTLTFSPGDITKTVTVATAGDSIDEDDEMMALKLSSPVGASIADGTGAGAIVDDDAAPTLNVNDVVVDEYLGTATFTVSLGGASERTVPVRFETDDVTARSTAVGGDDFTPVQALSTIMPGQGSTTVSVYIADGFSCEGAETFNVYVFAAAPLVAGGDREGRGTINDIDCEGVVVHAGDVDEAAGTAQVRVTLAEPKSTRVLVNYETAPGSAAPGVDFTTTTGTLSFLPGQTSKTLSVPVLDRPGCQAPRAFAVKITTGRIVAKGSADVVISDRDDCAGLVVHDTRVLETAGNAVFKVVAPAPAPTPLSVDFTTVNGSATAGADFTATSSAVQFAAGQRVAYASVPVTDSQATCENPETFQVTLTSAGVSYGRASGTGTIDDNSGFCLSVVGLSPRQEGATVPFTVTVTPTPTATVTVAYATVMGTATPVIDYAEATGTLTFQPGQAQQNVNVATRDNGASCEGPELFGFHLSNASGAKIVTGTATATITDFSGDCANAGYVINNVIVAETAGTATLTVTRPQSMASGAASVTVATVDGNATAPADYETTSGTVSFAAGETSKMLTVPIVDGTSCEPNENFDVRLSGVGPFADAWGTVTIDDVDC